VLNADLQVAGGCSSCLNRCERRRTWDTVCKARKMRLMSDSGPNQSMAIK
jgi:hypothetical protein